VQDQILDPNKSKNFELLGVDIWNGSASELGAFQFVTQVKFPLLQLGRAGDLPWGLSTDNIIIVDKEGIVRGIHGAGGEGKDEIDALITLINDPAPLSELRPKSLYYGRTSEVGVERKITVTVQNSGLRDLEVTDIRSTLDEVSADRTAFTVPPGGSEVVTIYLLPTQEGTLSGTVDFITNEKNWKLDISSIEIEGKLPPSIAVPVTSLDYGAVEVGRSSSQVVEIRNDGLGPLTVTGITCDIEGVTFSERAFTIPAGESRSISVVFQPSSEGAFNGSISVLSDDPDRVSLDVPLAATAQVIPADARTDFDGNGTIGFGDFLSFAGAFGTSNVVYDLDDDNVVGFTDFLTFVENFGRTVQ
jgi:hypothetical protein